MAYALSRFVGRQRRIVGSSATEVELMARLRRWCSDCRVGHLARDRQLQVHSQQGFGVTCWMRSRIIRWRSLR